MSFSPSRRSVTKAAAWSAPVVAIGASAPVLAASPVGLPDLSTSIQGEGSGRTAPDKLVIQPATLRNTGEADAEGVVIVFSSDGPAITDFKLGAFGQELDPVALGGTVEGLGTNEVTVTIPPSLMTVPADGETTSPATQIITFADTSETTLTVTVTASNGGVPFTPPPTLVPAMPADLSTSVQGEGSGRTSETRLVIQPATLVNTGGTDALGVVIEMSSSGPAFADFKLGAFGLELDPGAVGGSISGVGTNAITVTIPPSLMTVAAQDETTSSATQIITFADGTETTLTVVVTPSNGGVPFTPPPTVVPVYTG